MARRFFLYPDGAFPVPLDPPEPGQDTFLPQADQPTYRLARENEGSYAFVDDVVAAPLDVSTEWIQPPSQPTYRRKTLVTAGLWFVAVNEDKSFDWFQPASQPTYRLARENEGSFAFVDEVAAVPPAPGQDTYLPETNQPTYRLEIENQGSFAFVDEVAAVPPDLSFEWLQPPSQPTYRIPDGNFFGSFSFGDEVAVVAPTGPPPGSLPLMGAGR